MSKWLNNYSLFALVFHMFLVSPLLIPCLLNIHLRQFKSFKCSNIISCVLHINTVKSKTSIPSYDTPMRTPSLKSLIISYRLNQINIFQMLIFFFFNSWKHWILLIFPFDTYFSLQLPWHHGLVFRFFLTFLGEVPVTFSLNVDVAHTSPTMFCLYKFLDCQYAGPYFLSSSPIF